MPAGDGVTAGQLTSVRSSAGDGVPTGQLRLCVRLQGMLYLHRSALKSHGWLSSGACLVDSRWVLKVNDFGLRAFRELSKADDEEQYDTYRKLLWTAPELLRDDRRGLYGTPAGDVYSFGIVLQEILYRATPFFHDHGLAQGTRRRREVGEGGRPGRAGSRPGRVGGRGGGRKGRAGGCGGWRLWRAGGRGEREAGKAGGRGGREAGEAGCRGGREAGEAGGRGGREAGEGGRPKRVGGAEGGRPGRAGGLGGREAWEGGRLGRVGGRGGNAGKPCSAK